MKWGSKSIEWPNFNILITSTEHSNLYIVMWKGKDVHLLSIFNKAEYWELIPSQDDVTFTPKATGIFITL